MFNVDQDADSMMLQVERTVGVGAITAMIALMGMIGSMAKDMPPQVPIMTHCVQALSGVFTVIFFLAVSMSIRIIHSLLSERVNFPLFFAWTILIIYDIGIFYAVFRDFILNVANAVGTGPLNYPYIFQPLGF